MHPPHSTQMMCKVYIFSFGVGQAFAGKYVELYGTENEARAEMFRLFGDKWSMQYTQEQGLKLADEYGWEPLSVSSPLYRSL